MIIIGRLAKVPYNGGFAILGCPPGGCCRHCAGGWPGTKMTGASIVKAAQNNRLCPEKMGCSTLQEHAQIAVDVYGS